MQRFRHNPARLGFALMAALVAALLAACGGGGSEDAKALLDRAFNESIKSANVTFELEVQTKGLPRLKGPVRVKITGPYKSGGEGRVPNLDWDIIASAGGESFPTGLVLTDDNGYVRLFGEDYELGERGAAPLSRLGEVLGTVLPLTLRNVASWMKDPEIDGDEEIAGVETTRVSGELDVGKLLNDVNSAAQKGAEKVNQRPPHLTEQQREAITDVLEDSKFDVFVGKKDQIVRRVAADLRFEVPEERRERVGGLEDATFSFTLEFADVGAAKAIEVPTNPKPISELSKALGAFGFLGGLGGGSAPGATPGTTAPSPTTPPGAPTGPGAGGSAPGAGGTPDPRKVQEFARCIQRANPRDSAALQRCNEILQQ